MEDAELDTAPCIQAQKTLMAGGYQGEVRALIRSACAECRRRKQKCARYWPCNHCDSRRVGSQCIFQTVLDIKSPEDRQAQIARFLSQWQGSCYFSHAFFDRSDGDSDGPELDLEQLGYSAAHLLSNRGSNREKKPKYITQYSKRPSHCPQLKTALRALPSKPCIDALVDNFLRDVNFHYYIVHPTVFRKEYEQWWDDRDNRQPLGLQWTSLLLMACACSAQYPNDTLRRALEVDRGPPTHALSEKYHAAGRELHIAIPVGEFHMYTIQQFLHSCFWFKAEARYFECWHDLTAAVQVARELNIHCEAAARPASDFDREMGRRAWAIMCTLDWQLGTLLARPLVLDHDVYDTRLPGFQLDGELKELSPSPGLFMALQCELVSCLSKRFGRPCTLDMIDKIVEYRTLTDQWIRRLPSHLALDNPDTSLDGDCPWFQLQRFAISTLGLSSALAPLRPYLIKLSSRASPAVELEFRQDGIMCALKYMDKLFQFLRFVFPRDTKYHTVVLFIFDVATLLCSALIHDSDSSMPMRELCLAAAQSSLDMLRKLRRYAPIAKRAYKILGIINDEVLKQPAADNTRRRKRPRVQARPSVSVVPHAPVCSQEADIFCQGYDFTFTISNVRSSPDAPRPSMIPSPPTDDRATTVPIAVYASDMTPPSGVWYEETSAMAPPHPATFQPQYGDGDVGLATVPCPSTDISNSDGHYVISSHIDTSVQPMDQTAMSMPTPVEYSDAVGAPDETYPVREFKRFSRDTGLGVLEGLWDFSHVNLEFLSPRLGNR
ncbi:hypothetical protein V8C37DRAFT_370451 [Trichoderma ceciliae]